MTAAADTRTGYFVTFAYESDNPQVPTGLRETTIYLDAGKTVRSIPRVIAAGVWLPGNVHLTANDVTVYAAVKLDGLTREAADAARAKAVEAHRA